MAIIANTKDLLINAVSPKGETIQAWTNFDNTITKHHTRTDTEDPITISVFGTVEKMVESLELHAWLLQGVQSKSVEILIKSKL